MHVSAPSWTSRICRADKQTVMECLRTSLTVSDRWRVNYRPTFYTIVDSDGRRRWCVRLNWAGLAETQRETARPPDRVTPVCPARYVSGKGLHDWCEKFAFTLVLIVHACIASGNDRLRLSQDRRLSTCNDAIISSGRLSYSWMLPTLFITMPSVSQVRITYGHAFDQNTVSRLHKTVSVGVGNQWW